MDEFPYYSLSWFFYLIFAAAFLLFCTWHTRKWNDWIRLPLITFIAALALTPGITISGETWWSPAAIIMIFELDSKGLVGIWRSALSIIMVWIIFMITAVILKWLRGKKQDKVSNNDTKSQRDIELIEPD